MKTYAIYKSGSTFLKTISNTTIRKAAKEFIATLDKPSSCNIVNSEYASIIYKGNYTIMSDFVIMQKN